MSSNGLHGVHRTKQNATDAVRVSLDRCEANGNAGSGLFVSEPGRTDNATGVHLAVAGSTVYQNTFDGMGSGGTPQVHVDDVPGTLGTPSDVAPFQSAATGTNPVGNQVF